MPSIRDEFIENEVENRRVSAGLTREAEKILKKLRQDLNVLVLRSEVLTAKRPDSEKRRLKKLQKASRQLIREAYQEIFRLNRQALVRFALAESEQTDIALDQSQNRNQDR